MKTIGISQRIYISNFGEVRTQIDTRLLSFVLYCGYIPLPIPYFNETKKNSLKKLSRWVKMSNLDGLFLSGGDDIGKHKVRDFSEKFLISYSIKNKIPIYGVCRGMQIIGSLFRSKLIPVKGHVGKSHDVYYKGKRKTSVNSFHNFSLSKCPKNFSVEYKSLDGNIESIESKENKIYACMWHPERYNKFKKLDVQKFKKIFS